LADLEENLGRCFKVTDAVNSLVVLWPIKFVDTESINLGTYSWENLGENLSVRLR